MKNQDKRFRIVTGGIESKDAAANGTPNDDKVVALKEVKGLLDAGRQDIAKILAEHKSAADEQKSAIQAKLDEAISRLEANEVKFAELRGEVDEQILRGLRAGVHGQKGSRASIGKAFVESDEYKSFSDRKLKASAPFRIEGGFSGAKADAILTETSPTSGGALTEPFLITMPFRQPIRQLALRDLIPRNTLNTDSLEFIEQTAFNYLYGEVRSATGTGAVTVQLKTPGTDGSEYGAAHGFYDGQSVTFEAGTANEETVVIASVDAAAGTFDCTLTISHAAGSAVSADDYVYTAETKLKPRARATFARRTETVRTLATSMPVSRQVVRDSSLLATMLNTQLIESLRLTEETQMLYGDGSPDQLLGFFNNPSVQTYDWSSGTAGDTKIDAIRKAMTLAQLAHFPVDAIMIHPTDWQDIELTKDGSGGSANSGAYVLPNVPTSAAQPMLFRVPVIPTTALQPGDCLLGSFSIGCALWDREEANIRIADQHEDFFARNMELVLAEERMLFSVYYPESFVAVDFDAAP